LILTFGYVNWFRSCYRFCICSLWIIYLFR